MKKEKKIQDLKEELAKGSKINRGKVFILIREILGYNQAQFARLIGVKPITLSRWENNQIRHPQLNFQQCQNLHHELTKLNLTLFDLPFLYIGVTTMELKTAEILANALISPTS